MFSVIIPLYNKAPYIKRALDSVLNQTFQDFEIIVVNDGSTDDSETLIREHYGDKVKLINQPNQGVSAARNRGIKEVNFDYIAFLDADDYWHPDYLKEITFGIEQFPNAGILGTSYTFDLAKMDHPGPTDWHQIPDYFNNAIVNTLFFTSATVIRKRFFEESEGFDSALTRGEDMDTWFRAIIHFGKPAYNYSRMVYYSKEDSNQATKQQFPVQQALVSKILRKDYLSSKDPEVDFDQFKVKYVYFNLFPYLINPKNDPQIKRILSEITSSYFLAHALYQLPFSWLRTLIGSNHGYKLIRNYFKFIFRYIYTK
jgi:glycosyltransferase involved in cell wall biosynthesis